MNSSEDANIGWGGSIGYDTLPATQSFTDVAQVNSVSGPGFAADAIEKTHMASPNAFREFFAGLVDGGEVSFECNFLPGNATQMATTGVLKIMKSREVRVWRITFPGSPEVGISFPAVVTGWEPDAPGDDKMTLAITLKVAGEPTIS